MLKYKNISTTIQEIIIDNPNTKNGKLRWINICNAGKSEIEYLRKKYKFELPLLQLSSSKKISQRPVIEKRQNYLFLILHFPILSEGNIIAAEIDFFIGHGYLITLHNKNIPSLNEIFNLYKKDGESLLAFKTESSAVLLYEILEKLVLSCYSIIDESSISINKIQEQIFSQEQKRAVTQILILRRNNVNMRKILRNHKDIIKKLKEMESSIVPQSKIKNYYNRLIEHTKDIWENLENHKEMIEILNSTNESFLNYKISDIMKTLTIFSVIVFPLTLLAAVFGMNFPIMPFVDNPYGFWIIVTIMIMSSLGMLLFFEKKKWL